MNTRGTGHHFGRREMDAYSGRHRYLISCALVSSMGETDVSEFFAMAKSVSFSRSRNKSDECTANGSRGYVNRPAVGFQSLFSMKNTMTNGTFERQKGSETT